MKTPKDLLNVSDAARSLGRTRATLYAWKRAGCPHHGGRFNLAEVNAWAVSRKRGPEVRHLAKRQRDQVGPGVGAEIQHTRDELARLAAAVESPAGVAGAIERLRAMEKTTFGLYVNAHRENNPESEQTRARLHADVVQHLLKAEALVDLRSELDAKIWGETTEALVAWAAPVRSVIDAMPRSLAPRVNPTNTPHAEQALRDWVLHEFYPLLNAKPKHQEGGKK